MEDEDTDFLVKDGSPNQWIVGLVYVHPLVMILIFIDNSGGYKIVQWIFCDSQMILKYDEPIPFIDVRN